MNYIGLYAGCGGADLGFVNNGFKSLGAFDINLTSLKVLQKNICSPIFDVDLTKFEIQSDIKEKKVDVVFSGAPCQGFSTVGTRTLNDPRNNLLLIGGKIAISLKTRVFISENVMGSIAGKHKQYWDKLDFLFKRSGYKTQFFKINCLDIGMAQMRKRILFFAWKGNTEEIKWSKKISNKTLKDVLIDVEGQENNEGYKIHPEDEKLKIARRIKQTQKLSNVRGGDRAVPTWDIPEVFGKVNNEEKEILTSFRNLRRQNRNREFGDADPVHLEIIKSIHGSQVIKHLKSLEKKGYIRKKEIDHYDLTRTFNGKYRRLSWNEPSPTVDTRFGNPTYFLHPDEHRGFTVREAARIQGFKDEFVFEGSLLEKYKMIGNAVPPPLSEIIAKITKEQLLL